eukprot:CAMPEP_0185787544 /NCGR_PEP_ID=MMETSP1174-20130828/141276_1 /TAXON_ID=35687 /ORGANISM="Dictyocha speculum, Strain CCMP1381" /LENGTH=51 /DNA_ID=CAMNT_0028480757 /DNA_START=3 /DNA_END=154 /DNA_ORIENTATION=+
MAANHSTVGCSSGMPATIVTPSTWMHGHAQGPLSTSRSSSLKGEEAPPLPA